jgi:hypothetical protein
VGQEKTEGSANMPQNLRVMILRLQETTLRIESKDYQAVFKNYSKDGEVEPLFIVAECRE